MGRGGTSGVKGNLKKRDALAYFQYKLRRLGVTVTDIIKTSDKLH
jgi:hypothetical protein